MRPFSQGWKRTSTVKAQELRVDEIYREWTSRKTGVKAVIMRNSALGQGKGSGIRWIYTLVVIMPKGLMLRSDEVLTITEAFRLAREYMGEER